MRLFPNRRTDNDGNSRHGFILWRWQEIIPAGQSEVYLTRLNILNTPWFGIKLHWIHKPDDDRHMHDHPWSFLSIVLRGGYTEVVPINGNHRWLSLEDARRIDYYNLKRAHDVHRISRVDDDTITFVINGPKVREWGFHTATGWVHWREYTKA